MKKLPLEQCLHALQKLKEQLEIFSKSTQVDFIEALIFDESSSVLICGTFTDTAKSSARIKKRILNDSFAIHRSTTSVVGTSRGSSRTCNKSWRRTQQCASAFPYVTTTIDTAKACSGRFGSVVKYASPKHSPTQDIVPFGNHALFRWLFGWLMPPKISLLKLTTPPPLRTLYERTHAIQDVLVPIESLVDTLKLSDDLFGVHFVFASAKVIFSQIYPLWICPFKLLNTVKCGLVHGEGLFIDVGIYGTATRESYSARDTTRAMEKFVRDRKG